MREEVSVREILNKLIVKLANITIIPTINLHQHAGRRSCTGRVPILGGTPDPWNYSEGMCSSGRDLKERW